MNRLVFAVTIAALLIGASAARASMLYSTLGPGDSFDVNERYGVFQEHRQAVPFTVTGADYSFTSVELGLLVDGSVNVLLMSDANGLPGGVIESMTIQASSNLKLATSLLRPTLNDGVKYWIAPRPIASSEAGWNFSSPAVLGSFASSQSGGVSWFTTRSTAILPALRVNGDRLTASVPEPGSLTLALLGVLGFAGWTRRRRTMTVR